jgi:L-rhamnose mutarotase
MRTALHTKVRADRGEDHARLQAEPAQPPVGVARQARMAELPDAVHDCSAEGANAGLPTLRELP